MSRGADIDRLYREGVAAIRAGDKAAARERLREVVRLDRTHEQAWLWLSAAVDTIDDRVICLENVLTINPNNEAARRGLEKLGRPAPQTGVPAPNVPVEPTPFYSEPSQPVAPAPAPKEDSPLLEHAPSRIAEMMSQPRVEKRADEESWRQSLYDPAAVGTSSAKFIKDEPVVNRDLLDLLNTWLDADFQSEELRLEAKYGSF
jgi:hypothetical protein